MTNSYSKYPGFHDTHFNQCYLGIYSGSPVNKNVSNEAIIYVHQLRSLNWVVMVEVVVVQGVVVQVIWWSYYICYLFVWIDSFC